MRHEKLSPGLLLAFQDYQNEGDKALVTHKRCLCGVLTVLSPPSKK